MTTQVRLATTLVLLVLTFVGARIAQAQDASSSTQSSPQPPTQSGTVELPRDVYDQLVEAMRNRPTPERPAPVSWAPGTAQIDVALTGGDSARVTARFELKILEDGWALVPILPVGTAVETVQVGGRQVPLVHADGSLAWGVREEGTYRVEVVYRADAADAAEGRALSIPLPRTPSARLTTTLPGSGHDVAVIPSRGLTTTRSAGSTRVEAVLPAADGVLVSWRTSSGVGHALSRAEYVGTLRGDAVVWSGKYAVEVFGGGSADGDGDGDDAAARVILPLVPDHVTLSRLEVDGEEAPILQRDGCFAALVRGRGEHTVSLGFEVEVSTADGPPTIALEIPRVPVSRFELRLPGRKEVRVVPAAAVDARFEGGTTIARAHASLTDVVQMSWTEAVPDDVRAETHVDTGLYHAAWADEGLLSMDVLVDMDVRRGETATLALRLPPQVQIDAIRAVGDGAGGPPATQVADWRLGTPGDDGRRPLEVFLDRKISGRLLLSVSYGTPLPRATSDEGASSADDGSDGSDQDPGRDTESAEPSLGLPLLEAPDARRRRGMIALLATRERTLEPAQEAASDQLATRVGENQLPAFVRQYLADAPGLPVVHTFKYVDAPPALAVRAAEPERRAGRFDAQVDTLVSLGEVTLRAVATIDVRVKSGTLQHLELTLPRGAQLLGLSGPSVRQHEARDDDTSGGPRHIDVEFTQDMEGQFRLEASYEQILADGTSPGSGPTEGDAATGATDVDVPMLRVEGAEVEQGRLAIEALSAVEVRPGRIEQMTLLDVAELPRQLLLRTTHPILHAYKYVHAETPPHLGLTVTRHALEAVQEAAIDEATYRTLYTRDGLAVTRAHYWVRNSREQFLEVRLPEGSEIWTVFVDGKPAKPARKEDADGGVRHLVQILHSTRGFPVELVFETRVDPIRGLGQVRGVLPRPEILVTRTRWDVYLPDGIGYRAPGGELELVSDAAGVGRGAMEEAMAGQPADDESARTIEPTDPLRIDVPVRGVHFAFEKLYVNQDDREIGFVIPYASGYGARLATAGVALSTLLLWIAAAQALRGRRRRALVLAVPALAALFVLVLRYQAGLGSAVLVSVLCAVALVAWSLRHRWPRLRPPAQEATEDAG